MIRDLLKQSILKALKELGDNNTLVDLDIQIDVEKNPAFGDYSTNIAFEAAKKVGKSVSLFAQELVEHLNDLRLSEIKKVEVAGPGFINFYLSEDFLREQLAEIIKDENYGIRESLKGKTVMVEFTDPNPFKLFHIGHLMSNTIGEAIARLYEASGAKVIRANYQGDVGLHVAKAIWAMKNNASSLEEAYAVGSKAYEGAEEGSVVRNDVEEINKKIYDRSDLEINKLYDLGRKQSLEYFEEVYKQLGTKFDEYFFESEVNQDGMDIVKSHPDIFVESQGAIVFKGEEYGLHTRVFINSKGLPTYEAKELGLNKKKFTLHPELDLSVIVTGNEIVDYFRVLIKAMELVAPEVAERTKHVPHGMLRLPTGKMSSRTGDVITADALIEEVKSRVEAKANEEKGSDPEQIAIGAIKYSILKQSPGKDIIFDFDKSLSIEGDSGPYLQYAYARLNAIIDKAGDIDTKDVDYKLLEHESELNLIKHLLEFSHVIELSSETIMPSYLALYLYQLGSLSNNFYEKVRILVDDNPKRIATRIKLIEIVADHLKRGLSILGIKTLNRI